MRTISRLAVAGLAVALYGMSDTVRAQDAPSDAQQILILVNQRRAEAGVPPLRANAALDRAAQGWARYMAATGFFGHVGAPDGSTPDSRIAAAGYAGRAIGENVARGFTSPLLVMIAWMNSDGHRENILNRGFTDLGVGVAAGKGGTYWVQTFGGSAPDAPTGIVQLPPTPGPPPPVSLPPTISALAPTYARMGDTMTITGQRFGQRPGTVTFAGGVMGNVVAWTESRITVTVPYGASSGMVYVQTEAGISAGALFYVLLPVGASPILMQINPASTPPGATVRLYGRNLGASPGSVTFSGIPARIAGWSTSGYFLDVVVPAGARTGAVLVRRADGQSSNPLAFTVTKAAGVRPPLPVVTLNLPPTSAASDQPAPPTPTPQPIRPGIRLPINRPLPSHRTTASGP